MLDFPRDFKEVFFVVIGSILGSLFRYKLINFFGVTFQKKYWGTCFVNILSSFFLGFLFSFTDKSVDLNQYLWLTLFLSVGFLGSLSTFSTYILDLFKILQNKNLIEFFRLTFYSIFGGLLFILFGYWLGNV